MKKLFLLFITCFLSISIYAESLKAGDVWITDKTEDGTYSELEILDEQNGVCTAYVIFISDYIQIPVPIIYTENQIIMMLDDKKTTFDYEIKDNKLIGMDEIFHKNKN